MAWNEPYSYKEIQTVTEAKRIFNLEYPYEVGMGTLSVYCGGVLLTPGVMYTERNPYSIELTFDADPGEAYVFEYTKLW